MKVTITKQMKEALWVSPESGPKPPEHSECLKVLSNTFNLDVSEYKWQRESEIDITRTPHPKLRTLAASFRLMKGIRGHRAAILDIETWMEGQDTTGLKVAKTVKHAVLLAKAYFAHQPHQRVYCQIGGAWRAYHLASVEYEPPRNYSNGHSTPPRMLVRLAYREFGHTCTISRDLGALDVQRRNVIDALRHGGIFVETEALREQYQLEHARWRSLIERVGFQCFARGLATDDCDGNAVRENHWWWRHNTVSLDQHGEPGRVVVDVFYEEESKKRKEETIDNEYWLKLRVAESEDDKSIEGEEDEEDEEDEEAPSAGDSDAERAVETVGIEIPVYPTLAVFDLRRHMRLRVHVSQLDDYEYDPKFGARLILPADVRDLVTVLLSNKALFTDVIGGKGGGVCILCAGPPGTGKTLTAEVYSEVMRRPLYAVQTAQLGTSAPELENELRRIFARAQRWGALLLLDEADVYVRARGDDMQQNAIVGVFLRVLEYYQGILFMTTNRVDMVDDAIASRCVARIDYKIPHINDQRRIWRVLSDASETPLSDETIDEIVGRWSDLSGRDIKNLLKLARMVATSKGEPITVSTIDFVKRFKPTGVQEFFDAREGGALDFKAKGRSVRRVEKTD